MALFGAKQTSEKKTVASKKDDKLTKVAADTKEVKKGAAEVSMQDLYADSGTDKPN